jgi:hypothetical protein
MPQYQSDNLLKTKGGNKQVVVPSRGGVYIANPKDVATTKEFDDINLRISTNSEGGEGMYTDLSPPLFRYMQQKAMIKMVPHEAEFWAQYGDKSLNNCGRFATNPNFVSLPEDWKTGLRVSPP